MPTTIKPRHTVSPSRGTLSSPTLSSLRRSRLDTGSVRTNCNLPSTSETRHTASLGRQVAWTTPLLSLPEGSRLDMHSVGADCKLLTTTQPRHTASLGRRGTWTSPSPSSLERSRLDNVPARHESQGLRRRGTGTSTHSQLPGGVDWTLPQQEVGPVVAFWTVGPGGQSMHRPQVGGEQNGHYSDLVAMMVEEEDGVREQPRRIGVRILIPPRLLSLRAGQARR